MKIMAAPLVLKTNPYIELLYQGIHDLDKNVKLYPFILKNIFYGIDIFHIHWPESILNRGSFRIKILNLFKFFFKVLLLKLSGAKIVWTVHNFRPHERNTAIFLENFFYYLWGKFIDAVIFLSNGSREKFFELGIANISSEVIPHGHYIDLYEQVVPSNYLKDKFGIKSADVVIGHYGLIREYKNIPALISEFGNFEGGEYKLLICGAISEDDKDLKDEIINLSKEDDRVELHFEFLSNEEIKELYSFTDIAILPYKDIVNSGSALLALSLGCPVLVPNNLFMQELKISMPDHMVLTYDGFFKSSKLNDILGQKRAFKNNEPKQYMKNLDWQIIGNLHVKFYTEICTKR
jgi:glycosyltransferase involved in cell wall biosynthesis